ncbi:hypothetical protein FS837_005267 [Tulasnella sp. UAMH 9824]|nr:hypothetical protein FS837_005267 [Tulasnella sp. UAMH 9824]
MDFSDPELDALQTKLDDADKQLATAQLEMKQLKEKQKVEIAVHRKRWRKETANLMAELQRANKTVDDLTLRLGDKKPRSIATLVSEAVPIILEQYINPWVLAFLPVWLTTPPYQAEAHPASGDFKAKASISGQRVPAVSSHIPPAPPPSPDAMDVDFF